ncbi:EAL domain-containing protein [Halomonas chromatireducens]|uniref:cyclic-guanylate-specific phosphodiesterase n=1 Tax=Halomonas chromatireducens TaxID=507626 RepID=A0A120JW07_9GAMM|nr:EAL domain-containing protein [Halomonas chromatireducens]AMD00847.1 Phytochrome-like protein cph2 [Halomonas chromatireducens]
MPDRSKQELREALRQRDQFFTLSLELFCRVDLDGRLLQVNAAFEQLFSYSEKQLVGHHYSKLVLEDDQPLIDAAIEQIKGGQRIHALEARARDAQGGIHWVEINAGLGTEAVIYVVARDITQRKRDMQRLHILERSIESSVNGVIISEADHPDLPIIYVNSAFESITGYSRQEVLGRNCRFLQGPDTDAVARTIIRRGIAEKRYTHTALCNYRKDGTLFWNDLHISPVLDESGEVSHFIGVQNDISTQRAYESRLEHNATHDSLTGLPNRALLEERLQQCYHHARHHVGSVALLYIDLDDFKSINDSLGHELGDQILVEVASRLVKQVRSNDTVARCGGDEFAILLVDPGDVPLIVERLLANVARPYWVEQSEMHLTASIGIALDSNGVTKPSHLIQQADQAKSQAKRQGRNTFQWYTEGLNKRVSGRVRLRNALQHAIDQQQFELHYQPQIQDTSGRILGFEALIRWHHPERGYILPAEFIGLAEDTGQIIPMSEWVLRTACRDNVRLNALGFEEYVMAVNVSPMQFQRANFVTGIVDTLKQTGLAAPLLELELTENILMESTTKAIEILQMLRRLGISIALDDFGTGFSSLSYLKYLPIDKIKIDRSFIREVISDHRDAAIVQGIISMANQLQLKVLAEGVETQAHYAYLSKKMCDIYQGYYFARPMPIDELITFLHENEAANQLQQQDQNDSASSQTLLLLDDEPNILRSLNRTLRREGYRILATTSPHEAFQLLATQEVHVIISDQRMPEMSGTEFLKRVKQLHPQAIQIVLSGYTDLKTVTAAINEGAIYKFLTKPWDDEELRLVVKQAFREAALLKVRM